MLAHLLTEHPLVPYDARYFAPDAQAAGARLFSYAADWLPALAPRGMPALLVTCSYLMSLISPKRINPEIELADWLRFSAIRWRVFPPSPARAVC